MATPPYVPTQCLYKLRLALLWKSVAGETIRVEERVYKQAFNSPKTGKAGDGAIVLPRGAYRPASASQSNWCAGPPQRARGRTPDRPYDPGKQRALEDLLHLIDLRNVGWQHVSHHFQTGEREDRPDRPSKMMVPPRVEKKPSVTSTPAPQNGPPAATSFVISEAV